MYRAILSGWRFETDRRAHPQVRILKIVCADYFALSGQHSVRSPVFSDDRLRLLPALTVVTQAVLFRKRRPLPPVAYRCPTSQTPGCGVRDSREAENSAPLDGLRRYHDVEC